MNEERLKRFAADEGTSNAVFQFLLDSFLKDEHKDVNMLAASRLSVSCLRKAWRDLDSYKARKVGDAEKGNPGL